MRLPMSGPKKGCSPVFSRAGDAAFEARARGLTTALEATARTVGVFGGVLFLTCVPVELFCLSPALGTLLEVAEGIK